MMFFFNNLGLRYTYVVFLQAEEGIRDKLVTGVQTCALPIYDRDPAPGPGAQGQAHQERRQGSPPQVLIAQEPGEPFAARLLPFLQGQCPRERRQREVAVPTPGPAPALAHRHREEGEGQRQPLPKPRRAGGEGGPRPPGGSQVAARSRAPRKRAGSTSVSKRSGRTP